MSFESASDYVSKNSSAFTDSQLLDFYKYYKQATVGDCNTSEPGFLDQKGKAKWKAWNSLKGTSNADAQNSYKKLLDGIKPNWK